jgi:hypothetical protein
MNADKNIAEHTKGRLVIDTKPAWSPHRMHLRREGVGIVYWIQERKTGAARGTSPTWLDFDHRDVAIMKRLVACWNAFERDDSREPISTKDIEIVGSGIAGPHIQNQTLLRDRDELIGALRMAEQWLRPSGASKGHMEGWAIKEDHDRLVALLAKHAPKVTG